MLKSISYLTLTALTISTVTLFSPVNVVAKDNSLVDVPNLLQDNQNEKDIKIRKCNKKIQSLKKSLCEEYKKQGNRYVELKDYEKAINAYTKAIAIDPDNYSLYKLRATSYIQRVIEIGKSNKNEVLPKDAIENIKNAQKDMIKADQLFEKQNKSKTDSNKKSY